MENLQDMEISQNLEAEHHTQYILKPPLQKNNDIFKYINYTNIHFFNIC